MKQTTETPYIGCQCSFCNHSRDFFDKLSKSSSEQETKELIEWSYNKVAAVLSNKDGEQK
jgi:hypothetical protein